MTHALNTTGSPAVLDLFAGPGGWDEGLRLLGVANVVGLDWDHDACLTARAAGHRRIECDVVSYPTDPFVGIDGLLASPPCQAFSLAGTGKGRDAVPRLLAHIRDCVDGWVAPDVDLCVDDVRADLTLQPIRWVDAIRPRWVACEQVPAAMPLWAAMAWLFDVWGYSTWAGVLRTEEYGVPQTRKRALLLACADSPALPPEPTHTRYRPQLRDKGKTPMPSLLGELKPWISMAEALPAKFPTALVPVGGAGLAERQGARQSKPMDGPPATITAGVARRAPWLDRRTNSKDRRGGMVPTVPRPNTSPAPTVTSKGVSGQWVWVNGNQPHDARRHSDEPGPTVHAPNSLEWVHERPATTIVGSFRPDIVAAPGYRQAGDGPRQDAPGSVQVTVEEAATLQSFRPDYPWQGSRTSRSRQVGNAVPPLFAAAVLAQFVTARSPAA